MHNNDTLKRKKLNHYAKILIALSFAFFIYGYILQVRNAKLFASPEVNENVPYDTHTIIDVNESLVPKGDELNDGIRVSNSPITDGSSGESQAHFSAQDDVNSSIKYRIQNSYGIVVKYGKETEGYEVGGLSTTPIVDSDAIYDNLSRLEKALGVYPEGFWNEIKSGGIPLTIYLIDSYSTYGVTGITDSNYNRAIISIAVQYGFEDSFYHESYHYIERYMLKKGYRYMTWNSYNPPGYTYGVINGEFSYNRTFSENAYFVNDYAQTDETEDRASTFEYMMSESKASCLNNGKPVWKKASIMSNAIDAVMNTVSPSATEYWERFL